MAPRPRPRPRPRPPHARLRPTVLQTLLAAAVLLSGQAAGAEPDRRISCLGRIEPQGGVIEVASPRQGGGVIASLAVAEGDWVEAGQVLATLDDHALRRAEVGRLRAELDRARREATRLRSLSKRSATSAAKLETAELDLRIAEANLEAALARLELTRIRAPQAGQVLEVHALPGERVREHGLLDLGDTRQMVVVAEVYETDIAQVEAGQKAIVRSAALAGALSGQVSRIGLKVGRVDVLDVDPIAKADARVVEVRIALDESAAVSGLTNLQVEVAIEP